MRPIYGIILDLYPQKHRAIFGSEMLRTFERACEDARGQRTRSLLRFAASELVGLLRGLFVEWTAKWRRPDQYLKTSFALAECGRLSSDPSQLEQYLHLVIGRMELAIAHHDFPEARRCCCEERLTREHLERLRPAEEN